MELTANLAVRLVKKLEAIQPYNVLVINADGIVIAATDPCAIGRQHKDAYERICEYRRWLSEGYSSASRPVRDQGNGRCLFIRNQLVGAVGLSGVESKVTPYLEMVKTIAELILEREFDIQSKSIRDISLTQTLMRLISPHARTAQLEQLLAAHGIDPNVPRTVLAARFTPLTDSDILQTRDTLFQGAVSNILSLFETRFCFSGDLILPDGDTATVFVLCTDRSQSPMQHIKQLEQLCAIIVEDAQANYHLASKIIIGDRCTSLSDYDDQYSKLTEIFKVVQGMFPQLSILHGKDIILGNVTSYIPDAVKEKVVLHTFEKLLASPQKDQYLTTLGAFFENNMNIGKTAESLFIHRNTLQYRFRKIRELTGHDIYRVDDVVALRLAYLFYKMGSP